MATYIEVLGLNVLVLRQVVVLLGHEHTLTEEVLVDLLAVCLGDKPAVVGVSWMCLCSRKRLQENVNTYIVASSWRSSGNRTQCRKSGGCGGGDEEGTFGKF